MRGPGRAPRAGLPLAAAALTYLVLAFSYGGAWAPTHDEGVTWRQAIGRPELPVAPESPVSLDALSPRLDGRTPHSTAELFDSLMEPGGMQPPLYLLGQRAVAETLGTGRYASRIWLYAMGIVSLVAFARLASFVCPAASAPTFAAFLLATSPWFLGFSNLLRPYAAAIALGLTSTALLVGGLGGRGPRGWRLWFALASVAGLGVVYHYAFVLVWQGVVWGCVALQRPPGERRAEIGRLALVTGGVMLGVAPWLGRFVSHLGVTREANWYFVGSLPATGWPGQAVATLSVFGLGEALKTPWGPPLQLGFVILAGSSLYFAPRAVEALRNLPTTERTFWLGLPALPIAIAVADLVFDTHTLFVSKTVFLGLPLLLLALVLLYTSADSRIARLGLSAWIVFGLVATAIAIDTLASAATPARRAARIILSGEGPEQLVILSAANGAVTHPLLRTLREAGVHTTRIQVAGPGQLPFAVDRAIADPRVERVMLVPLDRGGGRGPWPEERLEAATRIARRRGWHVLRGDVEEGAPQTVRILPPVATRHFAM